jgi:hypothetical protein
MFHIIYSSESNFYKGLLRGDWKFGNVFKSTLNKIEKEMKAAKIFIALGAYSDSSQIGDPLHMLTIPIKNNKIDYDIIKSCIDHAKLKLMTMTSLKTVMSQRADYSWIYPPLYEDKKEYEKAANLKTKLIRSSIFDSASNGGIYFYNSLIPIIENRTLFQRVESKVPVKREQAKKEDRKDKIEKDQSEAKKMRIRNRKKRMDFFEYYKNQYAIVPKRHENFYRMHKLTTPKENVKKAKQHVSSYEIIYLEKRQTRTI